MKDEKLLKDVHDLNMTKRDRSNEIKALDRQIEEKKKSGILCM